MKKLIVAALALLVSVSSFAQLGLIGGVTSTSTTLKSAYADIAKTQNANLYHAGVVYKIALPHGFAVQPGVIYNVKGQSIKENINVGITNLSDINLDASTGYLEIPLQLRWGIESGELGVYVFGEPYVGYALTTQTKASASDDTTQKLIDTLGINDAEEDEKWNGRNRFAYGVGAGVGIELFGFLDFSVRYFWDLGPMFTEDGQCSVSAQAVYEAVEDQKCTGIAASLAIRF